MSNTQSFWQPQGKSLSESQAAALAVPAQSKPAPSLYRRLLSLHLQGMIDADPQEARSALEMSQEEAPNLWQIAEDVPESQWGEALTNSDSAQSLLAQIEWSQSGSLTSPPDTSLREILELLP